MKTFEFDDREIRDLLVILNFFIINTHTDAICQRAKALHRKLAFKKVTKEGWIIIYKGAQFGDDRLVGGIYPTELRARMLVADRTPAEVEVRRIEWEEEE
jgi:hypothetical protein